MNNTNNTNKMDQIDATMDVNTTMKTLQTQYGAGWCRVVLGGAGWWRMAGLSDDAPLWVEWNQRRIHLTANFLQ